LSPVVFRHPQANRELQLPGALVAYRLVRSRRRSIGLLVGADGLSVCAPWRSTLASVDTALQHKADWVVRKLTQMQQLQQRQEQACIEWRDGALLPYLGAPLQLRLGAAQGTALGGHGPAAALHLGLSVDASAAQMRATVRAWLMQRAQAHFTERLNHFAPLLGVQWRSLCLSSAQTRWGSAKSDGSIRLNWRLLHYRPAVIDYVVVHELAHLREMNHSPAFWRWVASVVPDYTALRRSLRDEPVPCWE
jgi:predicted metal-dependent hydrolase